MRRIDRDTLPHLVHCLLTLAARRWYTAWACLLAAWWGVSLGRGASFLGFSCFRRHPGSVINIGKRCEFLSGHTSNLIGINRPCTISTLAEGARVEIGDGCGFSGTVIGCAANIMIAEGVRCGANTLITDTDWHSDDPRSGGDSPIRIGRGVWLGVNVTVLKGVTIGENTVVAAGSLVTRALPANVIAAGSPAKVVRPLADEAACSASADPLEQGTERAIARWRGPPGHRGVRDEKGCR